MDGLSGPLARGAVCDRYPGRVAPGYTSRAIVVRRDIEQTTLSMRRTGIVDGKPAGEPQIVVLLGRSVGQAVEIGDQLVIGRATPGLSITDDGVSRRHAVITRGADGGFVLRDLGSRNGTFVNGTRIDEAFLQIGDRIAVGSNTVLQLVIRDRFEDQRIRAQKLQTLGELAGGIAHDFNNLLGSVMANVSHLQSMPVLDEITARAVLADVESAARRAAELTADLMAFARGGPRINDFVRLDHVLSDATRLLGRGLPRNIAIEYDCESNLQVRGDPARLAQVFTNIGVNAIAAMPNGGMLRISGLRCEDAASEAADEAFLLPTGDVAVVRISDTGVGMNDETRRRAFEPFFTTKPRGAGTGLGLATAMAIARDHGGHIVVRSAEGAGTTVSVLLPLRQGPQMRASTRTLDEPGPMQGVVLVADDEDLVRSAVRRVLTQAGLEVITARDGAEAVEAYLQRRSEIDLVILDLDMPVLDGEQALVRLRAIDPGARVLISSGFLDKTRHHKLRQTGIDGLLDKPYDSLTLLRAVAAVLRDGTRRPAP